MERLTAEDCVFLLCYEELLKNFSEANLQSKEADVLVFKLCEELKAKVSKKSLRQKAENSLKNYEEDLVIKSMIIRCAFAYDTGKILSHHNNIQSKIQNNIDVMRNEIIKLDVKDAHLTDNQPMEAVKPSWTEKLNVIDLHMFFIKTFANLLMLAFLAAWVWICINLFDQFFG